MIEEEASELETPASELNQAEKFQKHMVNSGENQTSVFSSRKQSESHAPPLEESVMAFDAADEVSTPISPNARNQKIKSFNDQLESLGEQ